MHFFDFKEKRMGLVKTRRLAAMQKQQRAKAGIKPPMKGDPRAARSRQFQFGERKQGK